MRIAAIMISMLALSCRPKGTMEEQCREAVDHWRTVSTMPMREGDMRMFMGACVMWKSATVDCIKAARHDDELAKCRDMEK